MTKFFSGAICIAFAIIIFSLSNCNSGNTDTVSDSKDSIVYAAPDTNKIPKDKFGEQVRYGRELMLHTAYYIGPDGIAGHYLGNKMDCSNCHQNAGTKPFAFSLMLSHESYPQYRAREGKVLSLAERVNNCVMRPHSGIPLPLDSKEMIAILSYLKWINSQLTVKDREKKGFDNLNIQFPERAGNPEKGKQLFSIQCSRCHGENGNGVFNPGDSGYKYPPLWGSFSYQPGSSMHRVIKQARWIKANMPNDQATYSAPILSDEDAIDIASFINDDRIHDRPNPKTLDYPYPEEKAIDYGHAPFIDTFSELQHKFGPYQPIIDYWKSKGFKPTY
ncbi:MAG: c-type cytochrome [Ferruginibacter sp.]